MWCGMKKCLEFIDGNHQKSDFCQTSAINNVMADVQIMDEDDPLMMSKSQSMKRRKYATNVENLLKLKPA